jgi:hypothetical protein
MHLWLRLKNTKYSIHDKVFQKTVWFNDYSKVGHENLFNTIMKTILAN